VTERLPGPGQPSGGTSVSGWKPYTDRFFRPISAKNGREIRFRSSFLNGAAPDRRTLPNFDPATPIFGGWLYTQGRADNCQESIKLKTGALPRHWPAKEAKFASCRPK